MQWTLMIANDEMQNANSRASLAPISVLISLCELCVSVVNSI